VGKKTEHALQGDEVGGAGCGSRTAVPTRSQNQSSASSSAESLTSATAPDTPLASPEISALRCLASFIMSERCLRALRAAALLPF
jgi:hypothetical protein